MGCQRPINIFTLLYFSLCGCTKHRSSYCVMRIPSRLFFKHVCEISIKYLYHADSEWASPLQRFIWPPLQMNALHLAMRKGDSSALPVIHPLLCMMLPLRTAVISGDVILSGESLPTSLPASYK